MTETTEVRRPAFLRLDIAPGSDEAVAEGCTCPVVDNGYGKGRGGDGVLFGWYINEQCPVHATTEGDEP